MAREEDALEVVELAQVPGPLVPGARALAKGKAATSAPAPARTPEAAARHIWCVMFAVPWKTRLHLPADRWPSLRRQPEMVLMADPWLGQSWPEPPGSQDPGQLCKPALCLCRRSFLALSASLVLLSSGA